MQVRQQSLESVWVIPSVTESAVAVGAEHTANLASVVAMVDLKLRAWFIAALAPPVRRCYEVAVSLWGQPISRCRYAMTVLLRVAGIASVRGNSLHGTLLFSVPRVASPQTAIADLTEILSQDGTAWVAERVPARTGLESLQVGGFPPHLIAAGAHASGPVGTFGMAGSKPSHQILARHSASLQRASDTNGSVP